MFPRRTTDPSAGAHGAAVPHELLPGEHGLPPSLANQIRPFMGPSQLLEGTGPTLEVHSFLELCPDLSSPTHPALRYLRGLIVAHEQMDVSFLHSLERLAEVRPTADPLSHAPHYLKEGKPSRLALG